MHKQVDTNRMDQVAPRRELSECKASSASDVHSISVVVDDDNNRPITEKKLESIIYVVKR